MTRHERLRQRERAVVRVGVVEAEERGEPGIEGGDVVHDEQLEGLHERALRRARRATRGAPLAVGDERRGEERQLGAVDGEERLGPPVAERHDCRSDVAERAEQRASTAGWASGASTAQTAATSARGPATAEPGGEPGERARARARGRARPRTQSAAAAVPGPVRRQRSRAARNSGRAGRPLGARASSRATARLALSRPMRCERPPASRIPATPSICGLLSPHGRHGPAGRRRP